MGEKLPAGVWNEALLLMERSHFWLYYSILGPVEIGSILIGVGIWIFNGIHSFV
jgi:hypothetical protein